MVQRLTEELTARRPLDGPSLWSCGYDGRNDDRQSGDGPSWASSKLDGEDDGPLVEIPSLGKGDNTNDGPLGV
ncbi:hypothetical protein HAX54_039323 [Datura stramonium]|uniref:Uncharacterized protein n=1 Tax=Datura stramonium TaxID=4076 RepID=A0ABS8SJ67_DATST|nr:hypothetical protein [Datura stramonium]